MVKENFRYNSFVAGDVSELKTPAVALTLSELVAQNPDNAFT